MQVISNTGRKIKSFPPFPTSQGPCTVLIIKTTNSIKSQVKRQDVAMSAERLLWSQAARSVERTWEETTPHWTGRI